MLVRYIEVLSTWNPKTKSDNTYPDLNYSEYHEKRNKIIVLLCIVAKNLEHNSVKPTNSILHQKYFYLKNSDDE